jgi:hypothetical protein
MFYRVQNSLDNKVIGNVSQQFETADYSGGNIHSKLHLSNVFFKDEDLDKIIVPYPILKKGAKVTDLIGGTCYGNQLRLLISNKLKNILEQADNPTLKFIKTYITHKNIIYPNYWFTHPLAFQMDLINYKLSDIHEFNVEDYTYDKRIIINNFQDFNANRANIKVPKGLTIKKLVLNYSVRDVLILERVKAGVSYYVSEKIKIEMENAGCTGIEFEPIEVA